MAAIVKSCPTCGATYGDDELSCAVDGTSLRAVREAPAAETIADHELEDTTADALPPAMIEGASAGAGALCPSCGTANSNDGDGYCRFCGGQLGPHSDDAAPSLRAGIDLGGYLVQGNTSRDEARAAAPDGAEVLMVIGDPAALALEAEAITALAPGRAFPRLIERGDDRSIPFLALSAPLASARKLVDVVQNESPARAVEVLSALLDAAEVVERAGFVFQPSPWDLLLAPDGSVVLSRLRGAERAVGPLDARHFLEALGEIFLPPALLGPTHLVRLLVPSRASLESPARGIPEVRAALDAVRAELAAPARLTDLAELCDPGLWRPYNQDATAIARGASPSGEPFTVLVVCDGVSSSSFSEMASTIASRVARDALALFARTSEIRPDAAAQAMARAIRAAHLAICTAHLADPVSDLPGTTIAASLLYRRRLTVGWVGDSRCYWLTPRGAELLTHDHSWVNEAIARGEVKDASEVQGALAHTITRCLGPLEVGDLVMDVEPDVRGRDLSGPGLLLLCSDGLWNYAPDAEDLARVMRVAPDEGDAVGLSRLFVNYALARGGQDNVSVAICACK